jgi:hypothetical protein
MPWNKGKSILGTGDTKEAVEREADVIFTAAFIGMTIFQNNKTQGLTYRVDMEPNTDPLAEKATRDLRTADDQRSMKTLNDVCSKVNHVIRNHTGVDNGGMTWGLTPVFDRGGMICAGQEAKAEYRQVLEKYAKTAYAYLTAPQQAANNDQRAQEMYIGRGAYCGLLVDNSGNAVSAMSTIRTSLNTTTAGVGDRWLPPADAPVRTAQYKDPGNATWGIIGGVALQDTLKQQGMRFYPRDHEGRDIALNKTTDIVGYTHGMIRAIYEAVRIGQGTAFEMSIGTDTFKLASCLSCSSFMMANGVDASSSHLGRGESWAPYYSAESHNKSHFDDATDMNLDKAIAQCNAKYAAHMHQWMKDGVAAMKKVVGTPPDTDHDKPVKGWVTDSHAAALGKLDEKLAALKEPNTVARDLYLDAMTYHKGDAARLQSALAWGDNPRRFCNENYDWLQNKPTDPLDEHNKGIWLTYRNPLTNEQVNALHTAPTALVKKYTITVTGTHDDDSCALDYSLLNTEGKVAQSGKLSQGKTDAFGTAEFTVAATGNVEDWKIMIGRQGDQGYSPIKLNTNMMLSGGRYTYTVTPA